MIYRLRSKLKDQRINDLQIKKQAYRLENELIIGKNQAYRLENK